MKLRNSEKVGYALGDAGANFFWKSGEFFLLLFYTDVFGLSPAEAGTMFLVARVIDAVLDPIVGALADRTRSRMGSFRPFLLFGAVPLSLLACATWSVPDLAHGPKLAYAYVTYVLFMIAYTIVNVPYSALMGVMTSDPLERTALSSARFVGAFAVGLFVQFATLRLVGGFGAGNLARGYEKTLLLYSVLAFLLTIGCFLWTKERIVPHAVPDSSVFSDLARLFRSRPFLALFGLCVLVITNFSIRGAAFAYFFKDNLRGATLFGVSDSSTLLGYFLTLGGLFGLLGVIVTKPLVAKLGKKNAYLWAMGIGSVLSIPLFFLGPEHVFPIFALNLLVNFSLGPTAPLLFAMFGDAADHFEWETGRRSTGLVFAGALFALKLGGAIGGFLSGVGLSFVGYAAGSRPSEGTLVGIAALVSLVPAALGFGSLVWFSRYPLDEKVLENLQKELAGRREREEEGGALLDGFVGPTPKATLGDL